MSQVIGAQLVQEALIARGVEVIFSISGGHITPIYQFLEDSPLRIFDTRHEQAAVFMAEAYGRITRRPGVALVTAGPGFTNALTAVANARMANSPLLLIAGAVGLNMAEKLDLQDVRQAPVIEPMVKKAFVCHTPHRVAEFVDMAYRTAMTGRPGPVYLELPVDVLNGAVDMGKVKRTHTSPVSRPADPGQAAEAMALLERASNPMIIAGSGCWYADAGEALTRFVEATGVPVYTMAMGRGVISDEHPLCLESAMGTRPNSIMAAQVSADLLIILGSRVGLPTLFGDILDPSAKIVQVDIDPAELGRNRSVDLPVHGDARGFLEAMLRVIEARGLQASLAGRFEPWLEMLRATDQAAKASVNEDWESPSTPIHPMRLAKEVDRFMDREGDVVVADGGDTQIWIGMTRTARRGGRYFDSGLFGCLGVGIPFANAAKLCYPDQRVLLIIGDGALGFNFMELEIALRRELPIVVVVANDLGWGMIRHSQELRLGHAIEDGTWIGDVPYDKLMEALGGHGVRVEDPADIAPAIEAAFASGKPALINVMTDPTCISPGSVALASIGAYQ
jgi:thiamine pyrophosphate-dependent acetolactate synthase large subunit-like protein